MTAANKTGDSQCHFPGNQVGKFYIDIFLNVQNLLKYTISYFSMYDSLLYILTVFYVVM